MSRATAYKHTSIDGTFDAIVIGSGAGGLGAAALLAKLAHQRVLVLERHYAVGGFTHTFTRPGYEWDVGVHYVGGAHDPGSEVHRFLEVFTEGRLEWAGMGPVYDRFLIAGDAYEFPEGREQWRAALHARFPREAAAIDAYLRATAAVTRWIGLYFAEKVIPPPVGTLVGPAMRAPFLRWAGRSTLDVLWSLTNNVELIGVLTGQWGDYGLPPSLSSFAAHAIIAEHYFGGAGYPVGGASRIADAILPVIEREGGQVVAAAEVDRILTTDGRATGVRMTDGREIAATTIISDAGALTTYSGLVEPQPATRPMIEELGRVQPSSGHVCLYVGLDATGAEAGLPKANLWVHPSYDHDAAWQRTLIDPEAPLSLFVSFPSRKDPSFDLRFPHRSTIEVAAFVPYDWFARWESSRWKKRGAEYDEFKAHLTGRLTDALYRYVPGARGRVARTELSTPLSTRHFMNHPHGEAYGLGHTPARFRLRTLRSRTLIENLYLTGVDVSVCGVMGALSGAALCVSSVLRRNVFGEIARLGSQASSN